MSAVLVDRITLTGADARTYFLRTKDLFPPMSGVADPEPVSQPGRVNQR